MPKPSAYPPLDGLFDLACRDGVDIRSTLLRVTTDLYVQKAVHTADEETQYVELALGLIGSADESTRTAVVTALRGYPGAPRALLERLGLAGGAAEVASARKAEARPEPARESLADLFLSATPEERRLILANLDIGVTPPRPPSSASHDLIAALERAAFQRNAGAFSRTLAGALGISAELGQRIATDASGEPLVVAARALGMKAAVLQRILLCLDPSIGQSVARVFDLAKLFDELSPEAARTMAAIWQSEGKRTRPAHEPVTWDDERRSARAAAGTRAYRAPRTAGMPAARPRASNGRKD